MAAECNNYLEDSLKDKTPGQQWHRVTHNLYSQFQHRCMARSAPEEVNLAANWHKQDVMNAVFFARTSQCNFLEVCCSSDTKKNFPVTAHANDSHGIRHAN